MSLFPRPRTETPSPSQFGPLFDVPTLSVLLIGGPAAGVTIGVAPTARVVDYYGTRYIVQHNHGVAVVEATPVVSARSPHCDIDVLHAPGTCKTCDKYPSRQYNRVLAKVCFTGEGPRLGWDECPATRKRPVERINRWAGNVADTGRITITGPTFNTVSGDLTAVFAEEHADPIRVDETPRPRLDEWLHEQVNADKATLDREVKRAGVGTQAAADAWPQVRVRIRWIDAIHGLIDLHTLNASGTKCVRCTDPTNPWGELTHFPCMTLRMLATAYRDRPGYDTQAWGL